MMAVRLLLILEMVLSRSYLIGPCEKFGMEEFMVSLMEYSNNLDSEVKKDQSEVLQRTISKYREYNY